MRKPSVRGDLAQVKPYVSPQLPAAVRLNTNESPYAPPDDLLEEIAAAIRVLALNRYPDRDANELATTLAEAEGCDPARLAIANGSNEIFLHLMLAFGGAARASLAFEPTYALHTLIPRIAGTTTLVGERTADFAIELDSAVETIKGNAPDVVIVCSPNNPTGRREQLDVVRTLAQESEGLVVVDEAYGDFAAPGTSAVDLIADYPNLVVTKTLSKAWRLAGARLGYAIASSEVIEGMAKVRLPYHLSSLTQVAGRAALARRGEMLEAVSAIVGERDRISMELQAMGIKTHPSDANFVLFEVDDARAVWTALLDRGVLIRDYSDQPGLSHCLRVTAGLPQETDAFLTALEEVI